jgi:hypothetical protein
VMATSRSSAFPLSVRPEGLHGTVLCVACGHFGLGIDHPEWCAWEVLKKRPILHWRALADVELGPRAAEALNPPPRPAETVAGVSYREGNTIRGGEPWRSRGLQHLTPN